MTTTWPRYREECEAPGYQGPCGYQHDCGQHLVEQEGRRLGSGQGACYPGDTYPRPPHGPPGPPASEGPGGGKARERREKSRHSEERRERHEEKRREHRTSERPSRQREPEPEPPPPPPPEPEVKEVKGHHSAAPGPQPDCADCAAAQALAIPPTNGPQAMELIESINPGKGRQGGQKVRGEEELFQSVASGCQQL